MAAFGGAALVSDYGHSGELGDTLRAFRSHRCVDPLLNPGDADITCDVDFSQLSRAVGGDVLSYGPVTQRHFLAEMGLATRLEVRGALDWRGGERGAELEEGWQTGGEGVPGWRRGEGALDWRRDGRPGETSA